MINTLLVLNIIVVILLISIILLQKSEGGVLGMGGSGSKNGIFTTKSATTLITKLTYILGALFFIICIALAFLVSRNNHKEKSFVETMMEQEQSVKQVKTPSVKKIPEDDVKKEMIKQEANSKPQVPTSK